MDNGVTIVVSGKLREGALSVSSLLKFLRCPLSSFLVSVNRGFVPCALGFMCFVSTMADVCITYKLS